MENLILSLNVVLPLFITMSLGYFLKSLNMFDNNTLDTMNNITFKSFLPMLLFYSIYKTDLQGVFNLKLMIFSATCVIALYLILYLIVPLIEKDNKIPKAWIGKPNEEDKYWCSQKAFEYIINRKNIKYYSFIEKFLNPEKLEWIQFTESKFQKENYSNCYNKYMQIAQKGLKYLDKVK